VVQESAQAGLKQILVNRLVSSAFCQPSGALVKTLQCDTAFDITTGAWKSFPNADGLVVSRQAVRYAHGTVLTGCDGVIKLFCRIPKARVRRITFTSGCCSAAEQYAAAIAAAEQMQQLQEVVIDDAVSTSLGSRLTHHQPAAPGHPQAHRGVRMGPGHQLAAALCAPWCST
jgi:hypothetical protein